MNRRALVIAFLILLAGAGRSQLSGAEPPPAASLDTLPFRLAEWTGMSGPALERDVVAMLGADDYLSRLYRTDMAIAGVFVGYHRVQKQGASIHSPLNCLPGAGWQPVHVERIPFGSRGRVTRVVVQKGESRQLVLYWYQSATRVEGNEYWSKFHLLVDALTTRRADAALVRIAVPVDSSRGDGDAAAARQAYRLAELVEPQIKMLLFPSLGNIESPL